LPEFQIDHVAAHDRVRSVTEQVSNIQPGDLLPLTIDTYDRIGALIAGVNDVTFIPIDPNQGDESGWNLAHVIVHLTAGLEERAALGSTLARGAEITGPSRFETDWETVQRRDQIDQRLSESRRIALAFLQTWPDNPNLGNEHGHSYFGPMNSIAYHVSGLYHARGHLDQIAEIVRQTPKRRA
jgi:hypothetical protein